MVELKCFIFYCLFSVLQCITVRCISDMECVWTIFKSFSLSAFSAQSPTGNNMMVPYSGSNTSLNRVGSNSSLGAERGDPTFRRQRTYSGCGLEDSSPSSLPYTHSPGNMEGPITFVAPELAEETLMDVSSGSTIRG